MKAQDLFLYNLIPSNREAFASKVIHIAELLGCDPNHLMLVMHFESKLDPAAKNPYGTAVGLIQFIESTAKKLGTSTEKLRAMSNVDQLAYVYKYLLPYENKINTLGKLYLAVFYPGAINTADSYRFKLASKWVNANKILDRNGDGNITTGEVKQYIGEYYEKLKKKSQRSSKKLPITPANSLKE